MATAKTVLKKTDLEAIVKVAGTGAAETIDLAADLLPSSQALTVSGTPTVNIVGVQWTGASGGVITITRNSVVVMTLQANATNNYLDFSGQNICPDTVGNTYNIVVTISGAQAECWLKLRKVSGYSQKVEYATYGAHDDETAVGS